MRRILALLLALAALCASAALAAEVEEEIPKFEDGKYIVGEDVEAGIYELTCVSTAGEQLGNAYGALGGALDALEGGDDYGELFGALGGLMETYVEMSVEIVGDYGDVLESYSLEAGESIRIELQAETAMVITDGSCTLEAVEA